jgi:hypothetical protein
MDALQLIESVEQLLGESWVGQRAGRHSFLTGRRDRNFAGNLG